MRADDQPVQTGQPRVLRVSEITRRIKALLEDEIGEIWIEGEVSNFRRPGSGHWYFTLKDDSSQLAAVCFRGEQRNVRLSMRDGLLVRARGRISVYEKSGQYQLIINLLQAAGQGALQAAFEALKRRLEAEGLFAPERKQKLPLLPRCIGLVTSSSGAALRDILSILQRRFSNLHLILAPVRVQGAGAAEEIAAALDALNRHGQAEVLIVGRGGGSLEDLWCFNEEIVARAVARSAIPVISAVGHETDFTICDFVADLRAPTPSAAAELVIGRKADFEAQLDELRGRLTRLLRQSAAAWQARFRLAAGHYALREPRYLVQNFRARLDGSRQSMARTAGDRLRQTAQTIDTERERLLTLLQDMSRARTLLLTRLETQLRAINPLAILSRGYSITCQLDGQLIRDAGQLQPGAVVTTRVARGTFRSEVLTDDGREDN